MRPEERDPGLLWDIRDYGQAAMQMVAEMDYPEFLGNRFIRLALERSLEVMGEAARQVSPEFKASHAEIPWRSMLGQRNIIAHEYGEIEPAELWRSATESIPSLMPVLDALIPP